jgi:hypothetical protein
MGRDNLGIGHLPASPGEGKGNVAARGRARSHMPNIFNGKMQCLCTREWLRVAALSVLPMQPGMVQQLAVSTAPFGSHFRLFALA